MWTVTMGNSSLGVSGVPYMRPPSVMVNVLQKVRVTVSIPESGNFFLMF